jgi:hypothetical protein
MGKFVLGIIVVICLDIAFVTFLAISRPLDTDTAGAVRTGSDFAKLDLSWMEDLNSTAAAADHDSLSPDSRTFAHHTFRPLALPERSLVQASVRDHAQRSIAYAYSRKRARSYPAFKRQLDPEPPIGPTVVILYSQRRDVPINPKHESLSARTRPVPEPEKNYLSKTLSVLKKPWDFTKFVASKLR